MSKQSRSCFLWFLTWIALAPQTSAGVFVVDSEVDTATPCGAGACSLRGAVLAANANPGPDTIMLPAGRYELSLLGPGEDAAATGDLDVTDELEIQGEDASNTMIDGLESDRIFDVFESAGSVSIRDTTLQHGTEVDGGCLYFRSDATLQRVTVRNCTGMFNGGAALNGPNANLEIFHSRFQDNELTEEGSQGGAIFSAGGPTPGFLRIDQSTFLGNRAEGGGAVHSPGDVWISRSTFSGNEALFGGAVLAGFFGNSVTATIEESTFSANTMDAICNRDSMTIRSSLVDGVCFDLTGRLDSLGSNIESPFDTCGFDQSSDLASVTAGDLALGALADHGGPTETHSIGPTSLAIDHASGDPACSSVDQRGVPRPQGAGCDSGSFERQPTLFADGFESQDLSAWSSSLP